jgi:serine/threonine protein kinase
MSREEELFDGARALPVSERAAYLDHHCADDPAMRSQIEGLLGGFAAIERAKPTDYFARERRRPDEKPSDKIGRYKLLQKIGEGGCGVVWMAEQEVPVRRRVALKVIKLGMDTKEVIARFEAERQALALMDHSNIAKVLDAGATDGGRPYFVMELVRGVPITRYCDEANLSTTQRLELFTQVCRAIQHAHEKGIVHRDIKPSNILVAQHDHLAVPKVIDFGIAKATQGRLTIRAATSIRSVCCSTNC